MYIRFHSLFDMGNESIKETIVYSSKYKEITIEKEEKFNNYSITTFNLNNQLKETHFLLSLIPMKLFSSNIFNDKNLKTLKKIKSIRTLEKKSAACN